MTLPWPPSINRYWRAFNGRNILSAEGRQYRDKVMLAVLQQGRPRKMLLGRLAVHISAFPPDKRERDLSNIEKGIGDGLARCGVYKTDGQIDDLRIVRGHVVKNGCVKVIVEEITQDKECINDQ